MEHPLVLAGLAAALYAAAAVIVVRSLRAPDTAIALRRSRIAMAHAAAALLLHALALDGDLMREADWHFDFGNALSLFLWQCAALLVLFSVRRPLLHLGLVLLPLAALGALLGSGVNEKEAVRIGPDWALRTHILLSLLAYGLLTLAAVQALALAAQDRALRRQTAAPLLTRMPPLDSMEVVLFELIAAGLLILSLALGSGLMFTQDLFAQHLVHKTVLSITAWAVFAGLLWGRWRFGWRGRKALRWTLSGYGALLLAYFGSKFVLEIILGKHW